MIIDLNQFIIYNFENIYSQYLTFNTNNLHPFLVFSTYLTFNTNNLPQLFLHYLKKKKVSQSPGA